MIEVIEVMIQRWGKGQTPSEGSVVYSRMMLVQDYERKKKSLECLYGIIQAKDSELLTWIEGDVIELYREPKDAKFNDVQELVYSKATTKDKTFQGKSIKRLAKYRSKKCDKYNYYGRIPMIECGNIMYSFGIRNTQLLNNDDKILKIKRSLRGKKSAITRSKNKAKKLVEDAAKTLFTDSYLDDKRYMKLEQNILKQQERYDDMTVKNIGDIDSVNGSYCNGSLKSIEKILLDEVA